MNRNPQAGDIVMIKGWSREMVVVEAKHLTDEIDIGMGMYTDLVHADVFTAVQTVVGGDPTQGQKRFVLPPNSERRFTLAGGTMEIDGAKQIRLADIKLVGTCKVKTQTVKTYAFTNEKEV